MKSRRLARKVAGTFSCDEGQASLSTGAVGRLLWPSRVAELCNSAAALVSTAIRSADRWQACRTVAWLRPPKARADVLQGGVGQLSGQVHRHLAWPGDPGGAASSS